MNTLATERRARIEELLLENKSVLVTELAQMFDVTPETIRADLLKLEKKKAILKYSFFGALLLLLTVGIIFLAILAFKK